MRKNIIIIIAIAGILAAIMLIGRDLFNQSHETRENPYEFDIDKYKQAPDSLLQWKEIRQFNPGLDKIKAVDYCNGKLFIAGLNEVLIIDTLGKLQNSFELDNFISSLHVTQSGEIVIAVDSHIEIYNHDGKRKDKWPSENASSYITSITSSQHFIYVADAFLKKVFQYDYQGKTIRTIDKKKSDSIGFVIPSPYFDIQMGRDGELWVVNPGKHEFIAFREDGSMLSAWNKTSMLWDGFSGCCNPSHIAILGDGSFVTSEKGLTRVKVHGANGALKAIVATPEQFEEGTVGLDIAIDSQDRIYIADPERGTIRVFEHK